ncbi:MAG TPA: NADH-quinone oxidoreductase subunit L [Bacteroidia bacterium]|nr:NADH-quinone oxidoreductase subunit L [Bacteroidia bacterium]
MIQLAWLIPVLPLLGFAIIGLGGKKLSKGQISLVGCGSVLLAFLLSLGIFFQLHGQSEVVKVASWFATGRLSVDFSFLIDPLSVLFMLIITGVGFLIHLYSTGYMHDDDGYHRFFSYMNLFVFFMLLLVMGSNYILMFVGWEGVGLCSYLLIGFWFKNTEYNNAAKKAFIVNRIGDLGFLLGMILIYVTFKSLDFSVVFKGVHDNAYNQSIYNTIGILLFIGACGKSAQIPLYTWLPDAMAGPTPVSALIHAATMVTSGIYMITRSSVIFINAPVASEVVALIGVLTAVFAATIGLFQNDIKKVLAYSTVSQLGYMFLGLGVGAFTGGVFHVMTHAFFKALLFLCAGSVIHAMSGEQDIRRMGGLKKALPITHLTFLIGTLAISGLPPFSGFFSKDEILGHVYEHEGSGKLYWVLGVIGSMLTAFYMFRLYFLTFHGKFRGTHEQEHHLHESPKSMTVPLMILAGLAAVAGFLGIPNAHQHLLYNFLEPGYGYAKTWIEGPSHFGGEELKLMLIAIASAGAAIYLAFMIYRKNNVLPKEKEEDMPKIQRVIFHKYYVDEFYDAVIRKPLDWLSEMFYKFFELKFIDGIVNGIGSGVKWMGSMARYVQTGSIGFYLFAMSLAVMLIFMIKFF